ncbi:Acetyl esterase [Baekduia alba]|uniref:alpha/beta hydrolase n=1 Tax=Baekduia alba TaxID=2997333 RepID=UPI0023427856|nr:alpha/beta hydrolase [Baekduia alba]WCB94371.1 Acetyl esterase [Baekduia alba]
MAGDDDLAAVHPQVRALLRAMGDISDPGTLEPTPADLAAERAAYLDSTIRLGGAAEPVASAVDVVIPTDDGARLPARLYTPLHAPDARELVVWLHGGGWYVGDIPTFDRVGRSLANASGAKVLLPEYRLAPEHHWPVQVGDADAIVRWARAAGAEQLAVDAAAVTLGGDSAGGQLALVAARHARIDGLPALRELLLVYPCLDPTVASDAMREFEHGPMLTKADIQRCWGFYRGDGADDDPDLAPLVATDWDGVPPTRIAVAGQDPLRDDGLRLATLLGDAGIDVQQRVFEDMVHGFLRWGGVVDATGELIGWLGDGARDADGVRSQR